jgi:hypothetical protein
MTKSKIASVLAIGAVLVGVFAAVAYAYDPESSEEAKADYCQSLSLSVAGLMTSLACLRSASA